MKNDYALLHPLVARTIEQYDLIVKVLACDPDFADTSLFTKEYGYSLNQSANTILVVSKKLEPPRYAACVALASTRLNVNSAVKVALAVKKVSFADADTTRSLTGMEIGGVTAIGISEYPILVDSAVMNQPEIIVGGGNRSSKLVLAPSELLKLTNVTVIEGLASE